MSVGIIGGGFCGSITLLQLIMQAKEAMHIRLFYKAPPIFKGVAFSTYSDKHLLNVAAGKMSPFNSGPDHFTKWVIASGKYPDKNEEEISRMYLPRNLYGEYLDDTLSSLLKNTPLNVSYELLNAEVIAINEKEDQFQIYTVDGQTFSSDKLVLATGNHLPRHPLNASHPLIRSTFYYGNPWVEESVSNTSGNFPVLITGTGLTMVDVVLGLLERGYDGKIIAMSPKGFNILPHRPQVSYQEILQDIHPPYELKNLFRIFREHIRKVKAEGKYGEAVVDAMRSRTQEIWQTLTLSDKKTFMTHVRHLWGVARHRLPADVHELVSGLIRDGRLEVIAGRLSDAEVYSDHLLVKVYHTKKRSEEFYKVQRLINCTGPESDPSRIESALFIQLLRDQLICVDEMQLGIRATANGEVLDSSGSIRKNMYVLGSLLRGTLWESTAVPELRIQAERIAQQILESK